MNKNIDFVVLWVDGNDPKWQLEKKKYCPKMINTYSGGDVRYRDWENLKYWFRGVETYAPWVNKIYFITWGHLPIWLNTGNKKLKIIKHSDFIPSKYLPVFSSHPIELNINRIKGLSEHFVLFNDDTFIINKVEEKDFFINGLPCDNYNEVNLDYNNEDPIFAGILSNNYKVLSKYYNKRREILFNLNKFVNVKYGLKKNLQTLKATAMKKDFFGISNNHLCQPFLKSYFDKAWKMEPEQFENTCKNKFRSETDINQYLIRYFQLLDKNFVSRNYNLGRYFMVKNGNKHLVDAILGNKYKVICINDSEKDINFEKCKIEINEAFDKKLNKKCSFEK